MTHEESQDLLLDLAYGELDAARAAEVSEHLKGCDECRKEKAALDEVRRAAAPLREMEEPPPGFDHRILEAARAQARLEHGSVGEVVEVTGSVQPLGLDAARIDAHGKIANRGERRRPRWMLRAAVAGSVATVAALAVVVSTAVQSGRTPPAANPEEFQIRVQPAPQAVDTALREAEAKRDQPPAQSAPSPAPAKPPEKVADVPKAPAAPRRGKVAQVEGSGGDAADSKLGDRAPAEKKAETADLAPAAQPAKSAPAPAAAPRPSAGVVAAEEGARSKAVAANQAGPDRLELQAQEARHAGNYDVAARLYRSAAALRAGQDEGTAAWDLAHAVECLAAAGLFDEARGVREELSRSYPAQTTALAAARRALREVDAPVAPANPADPNR